MAADTTTARSERQRSRDDGRRVRRQRSLPTGRAVVGGLLVAAAAVAVFAAYLSASAEPDTRYLVVTADEIPIGTTLTDEVIDSQLDLVAIELPDAQAARAISELQRDALVGRVTTARLHAGDLLLASDSVDAGEAPSTEKVSFPVPRSHALGGDLVVGERIDVVATYGSGSADATTSVVVRGALLVATAGEGESGFGADGIVLTVALEGLEQVQALVNAVNAAEVFVVRSTAGDEGAASSTPPPYRFDRAPGS